MRKKSEKAVQRTGHEGERNKQKQQEHVQQLHVECANKGVMQVWRRFVESRAEREDRVTVSTARLRENMSHYVSLCHTISAGA
jgi:hypothetical protein